MLLPIKIKIINKDKDFKAVHIHPIRIKVSDLDMKYSFIHEKIIILNSYAKRFQKIGESITGTFVKYFVSDTNKTKLFFKNAVRATMVYRDKTKAITTFKTALNGLVKYFNKCHENVYIKASVVSRIWIIGKFTERLSFSNHIKRFQKIGDVATGAVIQVITSNVDLSKMLFKSVSTAITNSYGYTIGTTAFNATLKSLVKNFSKCHEKVNIKVDITSYVLVISKFAEQLSFKCMTTAVALRVKKIVDLTGTNCEKLIGDVFNSTSTVYDLCYYTEMIKKVVNLTGTNCDKLIGDVFNNTSTVYDLCYYTE